MTNLPLEALLTRLSSKRPQEMSLEVAMERAAVSAILRPAGPGDWDLLFIKRSSHDSDPWSGHMAFPGGRLEPSDRSPYSAAVRETLEELGLDLERSARLITQLSDLQAISRGMRLPLVIRPFVFVLEDDVELIPNDEVDEVVWISLSWLLSGAGRSTLLYERFETPIELPCLRFGAYTIWGLTYHMLCELLELLRADPQVGG